MNALLAERRTDAEKRELIISAQRLVESPGMGTAYKAFAIAHADVTERGVPGFGAAPLLGEGGGAAAAEAEEIPDPAPNRKIRRV